MGRSATKVDKQKSLRNKAVAELENLGDNFILENQIDEIFEQGRDGLSVHIESQMTFGVYRFKVLEMQMHQDYVHLNKAKAEHTNGESVRELFNFTMDLYEKHDYNNDGDHMVDEKYQETAQQLLYISRDTYSLMEVVAGKFANIYERGEPDENLTVHWTLKSRIKQYPLMLAETTSANFLFSPNFKYYLDVEYIMGYFVIKSCSNNAAFKQIPADLIDLRQEDT